MRVMRLVAVAIVVILTPCRAFAGDRSWWAWLEELSGPGYFSGYMFSFDLACPGSPGGCGNYTRPTVDRGLQVKKTIGVTVGRLSSGHRPRFKDLPPAGPNDPNLNTVVAWPAYATVRFRVHRSLDVGPGGGALFFSGIDVKDHARAILIPVSASWKPALSKRSWPDRRWARAFSIDFETYFITKGFTGASFGSNATRYQSPPQLQGIIGISYDFGETLYRK